MTEEVTVFTLEKIKQLADSNKKVFVIHNDVFDVDKFLDEHPGGEEVLLEHAGKDATETFEVVGHSADAREMMVQFKIGSLAENEKKTLKIKERKSEVAGTFNADDISNPWKPWIIPVVGLIATYIFTTFI